MPREHVVGNTHHLFEKINRGASRDASIERKKIPQGIAAWKHVGETAKSSPGCKYSVLWGNPPFEKFVRYRCVATHIADK